MSITTERGRDLFSINDLLPVADALHMTLTLDQFFDIRGDRISQMKLPEMLGLRVDAPLMARSSFIDDLGEDYGVLFKVDGNLFIFATFVYKTKITEVYIVDRDAIPDAADTRNIFESGACQTIEACLEVLSEGIVSVFKKYEMDIEWEESSFGQTADQNTKKP